MPAWLTSPLLSRYTTTSPASASASPPSLRQPSSVNTRSTSSVSTQVRRQATTIPLHLYAPVLDRSLAFGLAFSQGPPTRPERRDLTPVSSGSGFCPFPASPKGVPDGKARLDGAALIAPRST